MKLHSSADFFPDQILIYLGEMDCKNEISGSIERILPEHIFV